MDFITNAASLFAKGGLVMYPLLFCSVIVIAIVLERYGYMRRLQTDTTALLAQILPGIQGGQWQNAAAACAKTEGAVAKMLAEGFSIQTGERKELEQAFEAAATRIHARLRQRLSYLDTIVTLAPLLGLLGTVTGMISSFSVLSLKAGQPLAITGGIGEALIATATGLCVAIAALIAHSYFNQRIDTLIMEMEETANQVLSAAASGWQHETH